MEKKKSIDCPLFRKKKKKKKATLLLIAIIPNGIF